MTLEQLLISAFMAEYCASVSASAVAMDSHSVAPATRRCTGASRRQGYTIKKSLLSTRGTPAISAAGTLDVALE